MEISAYNSSKIRILNFILIMMVLYIHSYYLEGEKYSGSLIVQRFLGGSGFSSVANRLFFFLSGMLFFNGINETKDCFVKMKKRVRTILIPYLIWNVIFVLWYVVLHFTPSVSSFVNSDILGNFDPFWKGVLLMWTAPASFPLWFLRDLICLVAVSPAIYLLIKKIRYWTIVVCLLVLLFTPYHDAFFVLGACVPMLSDLGKIEKYLPLQLVCVSSVIFIALCLYSAIQSPDYVINYTMGFVMAMTGLVTVWRGYDFIAKGKELTQNSAFYKITGYSFFIYLFHEPAFNIIKKLPIRIFGDSEITIMVSYILAPIMMVFMAIVVAKGIKKVMPGVYSILVGGRR